MRKTIVTVAVLMLVLAGAPRLFADQATIPLTQCNSGLSGCPVSGVGGPFGTVSLDLDNGVIDVTFQAVTGFELWKGAHVFAFNVGDPDGTVEVTGLPTGWSVDATDQQMDGFGKFEYSLGPSNEGVSALSFSVSRTGGFSSVSQFLEANAQNQYFAVHLAPSGGAGTGFVAGSTTIVATPEPAAGVLFGVGALGLALLRTTLRR